MCQNNGIGIISKLHDSARHAYGAILNVILCCIQRTLMCSEYRREALSWNCLFVCPLADYSDIIKS